MGELEPATRRVASPRTKIITIVLMILLAFMIVRDVFARRRARLVHRQA